MLKQRIVHASFISFLSLHVALAASLSHAADTTNELLVRVFTIDFRWVKLVASDREDC